MFNPLKTRGLPLQLRHHVIWEFGALETNHMFYFDTILMFLLPAGVPRTLHVYRIPKDCGTELYILNSIHSYYETISWSQNIKPWMKTGSATCFFKKTSGQTRNLFPKKTHTGQVSLPFRTAKCTPKLVVNGVELLQNPRQLLASWK